MLVEDIEYCRQKIAEEERAQREAPSAEAGCVHQQLAMLYKAQLAVLLRGMKAEDKIAAWR